MEMKNTDEDGVKRNMQDTEGGKECGEKREIKEEGKSVL